MLDISLVVSQPSSLPQLRILYLALYPILIGLFGSLESIFLSSLNILDIILLDVVLVLFPICWLLFCPIESVLCLAEALQFYKIPFGYC